MTLIDPIDKLVSSSDYETTAEHLSLSQGYGHSQHSQGTIKIHFKSIIYCNNMYVFISNDYFSSCAEHNDATGILNKPSFSMKHHRSKDDDQQAHNRVMIAIIFKKSILSLKHVLHTTTFIFLLPVRQQMKYMYMQ